MSSSRLIFTYLQARFYDVPFIPPTYKANTGETQIHPQRLSKSPSSAPSVAATAAERPRTFSLPIYRQFHREASTAYSNNNNEEAAPSMEVLRDEHEHTWPAGDPVVSYDAPPGRPVSLASEASSHSFFSLLTQQFRHQWAGALSREQRALLLL